LLRKRIEEKGFVITWYKPDQGPRKAFFRERNWLIAALSDFIVVVEAPVKSGALITASFALQMGKEVKAVPGDIDRDSAMGSNMLIFDGAEPILAIPKDTDEQYRSCRTVQDLVATVGSLWRQVNSWQSGSPLAKSYLREKPYTGFHDIHLGLAVLGNKANSC